MGKCIYCGHRELSEASEIYLKCPQCGLIFTRAELIDFTFHISEEQGSSQDDAPETKFDCEYRKEEDTLNSVWSSAERHDWNKALEALVPSALPTLHPAEFAVWRDVCQLAPLLENYIPERRCSFLNLLSHNLRCLDYFLQTYGEERKYRTLQRLQQILMLLGSLNYTCRTEYGFFGKSADMTGRRRAAVLISLAETLESQGTSAVYGAEYLKMSAQLYGQCLKAAREYCNFRHKHGTFICMSQDKLQLPPKMRGRINAKLKQINDAIAQKEPEFVPCAIPPDPKIMPLWVGGLFPLLPFLYFVVYFFVVCPLMTTLGLGHWFFQKDVNAPPASHTGSPLSIVFFVLGIGVIYYIILNKYSCKDYNDYFDGVPAERDLLISRNSSRI